MTTSFNASIGTKILLEVEGSAKRYSCVLVGYLKDSFILVTTPPREKLFSLRPALFVDCNVKVRYIEEGQAIGFQSRLIKAVEEPARLLFLSYPSAIEDHELRVSKRARCALPAELKVRGAVCKAVIVDINEIGLRCQVKNKEKVLSYLDPDPIGKECTLRFFLPGGTNQYEVSGEIRNNEQYERHRALGVQYTKISEEDIRKIMEYESKLLI